MKKSILFVCFTLCFCLLSFSAGMSLNLSINYNAGMSDFFNTVESTVSQDGVDFIEKSYNRTGFGFNLSLHLPVYKKFSLAPGAGVVFGHQNYEYFQADGNGEEDVTQNSYFRIYYGELNLLYEFVKFRNGINLNLMFGLNYNMFKADAEMEMADDNFMGMQVGFVGKFFELKHLGVMVSTYYRIPFSGDRFSYLSLQGGLSYRF